MLANVNSPLSQEIVDTLSVEINCEIILEARRPSKPLSMISKVSKTPSRTSSCVPLWSP